MFKMYARFAKKMADSSQLILSITLSLCTENIMVLPISTGLPFCKATSQAELRNIGLMLINFPLFFSLDLTVTKNQILNTKCLPNFLVAISVGKEKMTALHFLL